MLVQVREQLFILFLVPCPYNVSYRVGWIFLFFLSGTEISTEPSYILLNTAVSSEWGFPRECPDNCKCKTYDCHSNDYAMRCGFTDGFCQMMAEQNPKYKIHYVRVWQNPELEEQKVGCSTPERPTRRYIDGHEKLYKMEYDVSPSPTHFFLLDRTED